METCIKAITLRRKDRRHSRLCICGDLWTRSVCVCLDAFGSLLDEAGWLFERAFVITCVLRLLERVEEQDPGIYSTGH